MVTGTLCSTVYTTVDGVSKVDHFNCNNISSYQYIYFKLLNNAGTSSDWIKMKGYTINNLITDGSFENGYYLEAASTQQCAEIQSQYVHTGTKALHLKDSASNTAAWFWLTFDNVIPSGHVVYGNYYIYSISVVTYRSFGLTFASNGVSAFPDKFCDKVTTSFEKQSYRETTQGQIAYAQFGTAISWIGESYVDDLLFTDLTSIFGAGNEPSKEWCDKYIIWNSNSYTVYK